ncbi:helix-turn-helix domain-containing protein [Actinocorallia longicatena]|uniref:Helix-turn-helix domain-containing protein n=1 Tax=Actinocorallia longicatena TaxID=111803 RepID=A0ABP6Q9P2_9ACTN
MPAVLTLPKVLYTVPEAMAVLSLSRSQLYREVAAGRLTIVKSGRASRISAGAIAAYVAILENPEVAA